MHRKTQIFLKLKYDETIGAFLKEWKIWGGILGTWGLGITIALLIGDDITKHNLLSILFTGALFGILITSITIVAMEITRTSKRNIKTFGSLGNWIGAYKKEITTYGIYGIIYGIIGSTSAFILHVWLGGYSQVYLGYAFFTSLFGLVTCGLHVRLLKPLIEWIQDNLEKTEEIYQSELKENKNERIN